MALRQREAVQNGARDISTLLEHWEQQGAGRIMSLRRGIIPTAELPLEDPDASDGGARLSASSQEQESVPLEPWPAWPRQVKWNPQHELQKRARVRERLLCCFRALLPVH